MKLNEAPDDTLVKAYIELRDQRALKKKEFEVADSALEQKQDRIESILLSRFNESGHESVRTQFGTAYKTTKQSASVADRDTYFSWILDNPAERMMFLDARVNKVAVKQYREAANEVPPGVNWREEAVIGIRRS